MVWHKSVNDAVSERLNYSGASDFVNGKTQSVEYLYDDNGNLVKDENKGLNFSYDLLGHPLKAWSDDGKNIIEYVYAADGRKLQTRHSKKSGSATVRDFRGALEVVNGDIDRINFQGGFYSYDWIDDYYSRNYYIQDYQGNIRMTESSDDWGGIASEYTTSVTDYYPYGNPHRGGSDYKYSGKYLDRTYGLDLYDFEARRFDAIVPVFDRPDPLAWDYTSLSPYVYCAGDPVNCIDPTGMDWYRNDSTGNYTWFSEVKDRDGYTYVGEKGSMLGELEGLVDDALREWSEKKEKGLYEDNTKVRIDNEEESSFMDWLVEFAFNSGPEITIVTNQSNPYIQDLKKEDAVITNENIAMKKGYSTTQTPQWMPWDHFYRGIKRPITNYLGTYQIRSYSLKNINMGTLSLAYDRKSAYSLFLHLTENYKRSNSSYFGNTYQFYFLIK